MGLIKVALVGVIGLGPVVHVRRQAVGVHTGSQCQAPGWQLRGNSVGASALVLETAPRRLVPETYINARFFLPEAPLRSYPSPVTKRQVKTEKNREPSCTQAGETANFRTCSRSSSACLGIGGGPAIGHAS